MDWWPTIVGALCIVVGLIGIIVPVLPGLFVVWVGVLAWAAMTQSTLAWVLLAVATVVYGAGIVVEYLVPGKRMREAGISWSTMAVGVLGALVGATFIPVVGLFVGFPVAVFVLEYARARDLQRAKTQTLHALKGMGLNMLIELVTGFVLAGIFTVGVLVTVL